MNLLRFDTGCGTIMSYVAHLNADDFGPIQVCSRAMPIRFWFVALVFAPAAGL